MKAFDVLRMIHGSTIVYAEEWVSVRSKLVAAHEMYADVDTDIAKCLQDLIDGFDEEFGHANPVE